MLKNAKLAGTQLQGAYLVEAWLQGAHLGGAQLQGADLRESQLQGAFLLTARLQGADLRGSQLQGADLEEAQLQGANLRGSQLQGTDLLRAALWNISADTSTQIFLSDLRAVSFTAPDEQARARMLARAPDEARRQIEAALAPRAGARTLPRLGTAPGPILLVGPIGKPFDRLAPEHLTVKLGDYDPKLAEFLAAEAADMPSAAANIAERARSALIFESQRPLGKELACRLLVLVAGGRITLSAEAIASLKKAEPCSTPSH